MAHVEKEKFGPDEDALYFDGCNGRVAMANVIDTMLMVECVGRHLGVCRCVERLGLAVGR